VDDDEGVQDDPSVDGSEEPDEQVVAESLDDDMLGEEDLCTDGLRAHDLDLVDSVADRADREEPDFDRQRPRSDHTAQQLVAGRGVRSDLLGAEFPADGPATAEEAAIHLEDEAGHAI
jgi:hypothetical protein